MRDRNFVGCMGFKTRWPPRQKTREEGNLELLLDDGAGRHVESTAHLVATLRLLVQDDAAVWRKMRRAMQEASRSDGARQIARTIQSFYGI